MGYILKKIYTANLVANYKFEEISGNICLDFMGNYNGTYKGTTSAINDDGNCRYFNGTSDLITFSNSVFDNKSKFSFKFRIKTDISKSMCIFGQAISSTVYQGNNVYINEDGKIMFICYNGSVQSTDINRTDVISDKIVTDNMWHDILITWDGTTNIDGIKIYIDDLINPDVVGKMKTMPKVTPSNFQIGRSNYDGYYSYFKGYLDEIEIYNDVIEFIPGVFLIKTQDDKIQILSNNEWVDLNLTSPTQADFDKYGMNNLSLMTAPSTTYNKSLQLDRAEGTGKIYKTTIDATKFKKQIQQIKSI